MSCELHRLHSPGNLTVELHHIVPVAWQLHWQPPVAPYPGVDPDGRGNLWDARTAAICPTGHRNVHHWIVQMMHALGGGGVPLEGWVAAKAARGGKQAQMAYQALARFADAGGALQALVAAKEWGEA